MNQLTDALHIPDTQSERDVRHLAIQRVGIKDVRYPLQLKVAGAVQSTAATWALDVALPADKQGTHMSRFIAWLDALDAPKKEWIWFEDSAHSPLAEESEGWNRVFREQILRG